MLVSGIRAFNGNKNNSQSFNGIRFKKEERVPTFFGLSSRIDTTINTFYDWFYDEYQSIAKLPYDEYRSSVAQHISANKLFGDQANARRAAFDEMRDVISNPRSWYSQKFDGEAFDNNRKYATPHEKWITEASNDSSISGVNEDESHFMTEEDIIKERSDWWWT